MDIQVICIEREDDRSSGIMMNNKYVITTAKILMPLLNDNINEFLRTIPPGKLYPYKQLYRYLFTKEPKNLNIIWKKTDDRNGYHVKKGEILAMFMCNDIKSTEEQTFQDWTIETSQISDDLTLHLSLFLVIKLDQNGSILDFKNVLKEWLDIIKSEIINQFDEIFVKSVPFGNRIFLDSYSRGIVSNIVGKNSCLIVSDCPTAPYSEGSPVYKLYSQLSVPIGMVISSSCRWRGDWSGLILIVDIRFVLLDLLRDKHKIELKIIPHQCLIACVESSLLQVYSGSQWGTAIIINAKEGILLTNSHVIGSKYKIKIYWKGHMSVATLIYKTPSNEVFDLAVLKCDFDFLKRHNLVSINISKQSISVGKEVIAAGFAIFSKNVKSNPMISKGFIIQNDISMLKTTCCVNPGMSGGAILDTNGDLLGIMVCNTKIEKSVYPRFNMAIPYTAISNIVDEFSRNKDVTILDKLHTHDPMLLYPWINLRVKAKL